MPTTSATSCRGTSSWARRWRPSCSYYPTVTREEYQTTGRLTDLIESGKMFADLGVAPLDPAHDRVMICGSRGDAGRPGSDAGVGAASTRATTRRPAPTWSRRRSRSADHRLPRRGRDPSMAYDFDLLVIGGGSGGVRCARIAATHGARVAVAESRHWGGTCVNLGCVPKKMMVQASEYGDQAVDGRGFGWSTEPGTHDWRHADGRQGRARSAASTAPTRRLLEGAGVTRFEAHARFEDAHTLLLQPGPLDRHFEPRRVTAERIVIAVGGHPVVQPHIEGHELGIDLGPGLPPARAAAAGDDRRRRLYRRRVLRHLRGAGLRGAGWSTASPCRCAASTRTCAPACTTPCSRAASGCIRVPRCTASSAARTASCAR